MAAFCLASSLEDLEARLRRMVVARITGARAGDDAAI